MKRFSVAVPDHAVQAIDSIARAHRVGYHSSPLSRDAMARVLLLEALRARGVTVRQDWEADRTAQHEALASASGPQAR